MIYAFITLHLFAGASLIYCAGVLMDEPVLREVHRPFGALAFTLGLAMTFYAFAEFLIMLEIK